MTNGVQAVEILMKLSAEEITSFQKFIWNFYAMQGRAFPWRNVEHPYLVLVSEIMLQQTQTYRVEPKYERFILAFPSVESLAHASLRDVLILWQGLGYNRRAQALHTTAQKIMQEYHGHLPSSPEILQKLPGIGQATAHSIAAFAFNYPAVFIETNIRAVFIHSFFKQEKNVTDKQLLPLVQQTLDKNNPREWYYALMDYGVMLKKMYKNPARASAHHVKQSKFEGSDRQIRGAILRTLTQRTECSECTLKQILDNDERVEKILADLCSEGLIKKNQDFYFI